MGIQEKIILLSIFGLSFLLISIWVYKGDKDSREDKFRRFQDQDVEEYIKSQVGEDYYNKHYKKK